jgi:hypothetical protein
VASEKILPVEVFVIVATVSFRALREDKCCLRVCGIAPVIPLKSNSRFIYVLLAFLPEFISRRKLKISLETSKSIVVKRFTILRYQWMI